MEEFHDRVASIEPTPAGVAVAAVSASLGLALLEKVVRITARRKDFSGDRARLAEIVEAAGASALRLARCADDDIAAFNEYMACLRLAKDTVQQREERERALGDALRTAIEVPMNTARYAAAGLDLCAEAAGFVHEFVASDLGSAAVLLTGAVRATLLSVDFNLRQLHDGQFHRDVVRERKELQILAIQKSDSILEKIAERANRLHNAP